MKIATAIKKILETVGFLTVCVILALEVGKATIFWK